RLGVMADDDFRALLPQALDVGIVGRIRTLHGVAKINQHLGNAAHANSADADKMDRTYFGRQFHADEILLNARTRIFLYPLTQFMAQRSKNGTVSRRKSFFR